MILCYHDAGGMRVTIPPIKVAVIHYEPICSHSGHSREYILLLACKIRGEVDMSAVHHDNYTCLYTMTTCL